MSASRPFQGDTGEGDDFSSQRAGGRGGGTEGRRRSGACPVCGAKLRNPPRFRRRSPAFFCIGPRWSAVLRAFVPVAPREVEKLRVFRLRPPVFSSFARAFFVRWPGHPSPRGEVCCPSRARIAHPSATFRFFPSPLHPPDLIAMSINRLGVKVLFLHLHTRRPPAASCGKHIAMGSGEVSFPTEIEPSPSTY